MNWPLPIRLMLWPLSVAYGLIARGRAWLYAHGWLKQKRLNGAVISVGNLTVGGTGKTPMVLWLAERLLAQGKRVAILSRGYRGSGGTCDEVELLRMRLGPRVPIGVGKNRFGLGKQLEAEKIDVYLLDDGFQHLQLARDLDIVLLDLSRPLRHDWLIPAGRLREPRSALNRADLVVFTHAENQTLAASAMQELHQFPIFPSTLRLLGFRPHAGHNSSKLLTEISDEHVFAFCGIGNPDAFFRDLARWRVRVVGRASFPDHHRYTVSDLARLEHSAARAGAKAFVSTEKDAENLGSLSFSMFPLYLAVVEMAIPDEKQFLLAITHRLSARRGAAA